MEYRHREIIKKYTPTLQQSINLSAMRDSLCKSKIFTTMMINAIFKQETSFFEELPTRGPNAFHCFINLLKTNGYNSIAEEMLHVSNPAYHIPDQHGFYFILLNCDWKDIENPEELENIQDVCEAEAQELEGALRKIGYKVEKFKTNLGSSKIHSFLRQFSEKDFSNVNSCIVIILGFTVKSKDSKVICASNGEYISLNEILNLFSDNNCPSLKNKPKIFLLSSALDIPQDIAKDCKESVEISPYVNDSFLWYFPSVDNYKFVTENNYKYFGSILSQNLKSQYQKSDFEIIFKSSYIEYSIQFSNGKLNIPECERLGNYRETIYLH